jgi:hypothetical protein
MKYILVLYMCSMLSNNCPTSTITGYQFNTYYDCVNAGYAVAQKTYRNLKELEEWDREYLEQSKIVVKFECKELKVDA